jgi:hypothetical protein
LRIVEQMRDLLQTFAVMAAMFAILAVGAGLLSISLSVVRSIPNTAVVQADCNHSRHSRERCP